MAARAKIGDRSFCPACDAEIEYHGNRTWLDRGGNSHHDTSSGRHDQDGIPILIRPGAHRPPGGDVARLRAYDRQEAVATRDRAAFERWKARGRPRSRGLLGRTAARTARRRGAR